ncbi:MAG: tetratricopeptide repeat protein [Proteobacteria bacterium]|nr:tetratricopeptide repeat protein [Pseudomonadota bacterium]
MTAAVPPSNRWLFGPVPDLLLGCGLLSALLFVAFAFVDGDVPARQAPVVFPLVVLLLSYPHYGATILRVYERREDRQNYFLFSVWATVAVAAFFVLGVYSTLVASVMVTVYLTWSPWHYTGQNYGLAVMFLRRRGVEIGPREKRFVYASFILSYVLTALVMHGGTESVDYALSSPSEGDIHFTAIGIPAPVEAVLFPLALLAYLGATAAAVVLLLRRGSVRDLAPAGMLMLTQALWFSVPMLARHFEITTGLVPIDWDFRFYFFTWIAAGHAVQYLWVTSYYARAEGRAHGPLRFYGKTLLGGTLLFVPPVILFGPGGLGSVSLDAGLALLVSAGVNIHHFILDGAIWKLRSGRIANILIRNTRPEPIAAGPGSQTAMGWGSKALWATAALALAIHGYTMWQERVALVVAAQESDLVRMSEILDQLAWVSRDHERIRSIVAAAWLEQEQLPEALREFERSVALRPTVAGYSAIAQLHERLGRPALGIPAYESALALEPDRLGILHRLGAAWVRQQRPARAIPYLERAVALDPEHEPSRRTLTVAREMQARPQAATPTP